MSQETGELVLVHAPFGRDGAMICEFLVSAGIRARACARVEQICEGLNENVGAALVSDEALNRATVSDLAKVLRNQPPWSDLPLIVTTSAGEATTASRRRLELLEPLGNFTLLERPLRVATLISAVQGALRARRRQYQIRDHVVEREKLVQELQRSNDELTQFAHVVSHDLQAPVRMVKSYSELLARRYQDRLDQTANEFITAIQEGASTMEALIRTLLAYATVGQGPLRRRRVGLQSVVDAVITTLQPTIDELGADVTYGDLPAVYGDRVLLQQLIQNLVGNSLKYSGGAAPKVNIQAVNGRTECVVSVTDNGPGIAAEYHQTIFLPLKRLHGHDISGTGMGLAVCRRIAERHGGKIWVHSEPGKGATFYFTVLQPEGDQKREVADVGAQHRGT